MGREFKAKLAPASAPHRFTPKNRYSVSCPYKFTTTTSSSD